MKEMKEIKDKAMEILDIAKRIYQIQENNNPNVIFKDKIFLIGTEEDPEAVSWEIDYDNEDCSYYFETPVIDGVIIKLENGNYCIKAMVYYTNAKKQSMWFAKIRIEQKLDGDIQIMGSWGGSWEQEDEVDENLLKKQNQDFPFALDAMRNHLSDIYKHFCESNELNGLYEPQWVKRLKLYNH